MAPRGERGVSLELNPVNTWTRTRWVGESVGVTKTILRSDDLLFKVTGEWPDGLGCTRHCTRGRWRHPLVWSEVCRRLTSPPSGKVRAPRVGAWRAPAPIFSPCPSSWPHPLHRQRTALPSPHLCAVTAARARGRRPCVGPGVSVCDLGAVCRAAAHPLPREVGERVGPVSHCAVRGTHW